MPAHARWPAVGLFVLALALLGVTPIAQTSPPPAQVPAFRAAVELVPVAVTVEQTDGSYVRGLREAQFRVMDEGLVRPIQLFEAGTVPVDLALLLDTSSSMNARLPTMQRGAERLVRALRPADRASIMSFGIRTSIVHPFSSDTAALTDAIASLSCRGSTGLYDAMYVALREFGASQTDMRRRAIVVFSDGDDTASLTTFDTVLDVARRLGVATYTIRLVSPFERIDRFARAAFELGELARETGARSFTTQTADDLSGAYESIASELAHQYVVAFELPGDLPRGYRRVHVLVDAPHSRIRARAGYIVSARHGA